ncbi:MAG: glycosyltransferase family 2 protein [Muribaculum sp.]|nr:glycosyltransferase family 2 protein [Muribaculaceae bacterium]MCM1080226.1 glycosyltransferase family 2 protein [Muribaculum sp.]
MNQTVKPVAVIILNWNGEKMLRRYLPAVIATTPADAADIIVADNGSTDGSLKLLTEEFPQAKVIRFDKNYGFAEGYNRAIAAVDNKYVVLLNSDVATGENWLRPMLAFMEANPAVGACQPKILSDADHGLFEYAGASGGFLDKNGFPYCRGRLFDVVEEDHGQYNDIVSVDWASGACLFVRRDIYLKSGGLDSSFFAHMEEIDLCWRIRRLGYDVVVMPQSAVYHLGGGTLPAGNPQKTYLNFRNNLLLLHKNLPQAVRRRRLFVRRLYDTVAGAMFLAAGKWAEAKAVARAHRDFIRMRRRVAAPTGMAEIDLTAGRPNIISKFYIKRCRSFANL